MLKRFSQEKYEEGGKQESLEKKQEKEQDIKGYNTSQRELSQKQEFLDRKQEISEDTREYYAEKGKLW